MHTPLNPFKRALQERRQQIGLWLGLADSYSAEICAGAGFDWLVVDAEHGPQDLRGIVAQLQAIDCHPPAHAVLRVPAADDVILKQHLDLGAQTILVPMVDTADQAAAVVRACRYPPAGIRGVAFARASQWGRRSNYLRESDEQLCVVVQVETVSALDNLEAIAAVEGIDGVFIGAADLSASMGYIGQPLHPVVQQTVIEAFQRILAQGKAPGTLAFDEASAWRYLDGGGVFVAVGADTALLARETSRLAERFRASAAS